MRKKRAEHNSSAQSKGFWIFEQIQIPFQNRYCRYQIDTKCVLLVADYFNRQELAKYQK